MRGEAGDEIFFWERSGSMIGWRMLGSSNGGAGVGLVAEK